MSAANVSTRRSNADSNNTDWSNSSSNGRAALLRPWHRDRKTPRETAEAGLTEGIGLAAAIALNVVHADIVPISKPRPSTLLGGGAVDGLKGLLVELEVDVVIVDANLTPIQQRNLERAWSVKVIDRTGLILEIFGERARTREGQLQVELAALTYQRSRLVRSWTHLERQRGALGFVGGPGESQLEIDRRLIGDRIAKLRRRLEQVKRTRGLHREARARVPYPVVALVGYTNAGKSTLFNRLTDGATFAHDQLFATLDPTMRAVTLPSGREIILSDTVGFISDLPHDLVEAFSATLEEVTAASAVVHVRDVAHPHHERQKSDVEAVLSELTGDRDKSDEIEIDLEGPLRRPLQALNKIDLLDDTGRADVAATVRANADCVAVSAVSGEGIDALLLAIDTRLAEAGQEISVNVALADGANIAWLYRRGQVIERRDDEATAHFTVRLAKADVARLERREGMSIN